MNALDSMLFAFNAVGPILLMMVIGYMLKRVGLFTEDFAKAANKLVFRVFLPAMLFINIYEIDDLGSINLGYVAYAIGALMVFFFLCIPLVYLITPVTRRRGVLMQVTIRSNYALIGIPLADALFGQSGVAIASLLSAFTIPIFNTIGVISLTMFSGEDGERKKIDVKKIIFGILKNPLIQGVAAGLAVLAVRALFVNVGAEFRLSDVTVLMKVLKYLSSVATPLALLTLGAQFEFSAVSSLRREIMWGTLIRTVIVPALGIGVAYLFFRDSFSGAHFATFIALYATPLAVSTVPMTQEMGGDAILAGQLVVWTTLISTVSIFIAAFLLRLGGVF